MLKARHYIGGNVMEHCDAATSPAADRRAHPRHECRLNAVLRSEDGSFEMAGTVCNISVGGVAIALPSVVPVGEAIVYLRSKSSAGGYVRLVRVVFNETRIPGAWLHGAVFDAPLSEPCLQYMLGN